MSSGVRGRSKLTWIVSMTHPGLADMTSTLSPRINASFKVVRDEPVSIVCQADFKQGL